MQPTKLYIVVRNDLPSGLQAAQAVHAALSFAHEYPKPADDWYMESNFVVILQAVDEAALKDNFSRLSGVPHRVMVFEPDLDNEATAFAALGSDAGRLLSSLPLCMKEPAMV